MTNKSLHQPGLESMRALRDGVLALLFLGCVVPAFAQSAEAPQAAPTQPAAPQAPARPRPRRVVEVPCWKQAGLTPDMVNQRWKIEDQGKVKIAAACKDPTTSAQQKRTKIEEIHTETEQAFAKLVSSKQLEVFKSCRAEGDKKNPKLAGEKELGPCGGAIPAEGAHDAMDHEHH